MRWRMERPHERRSTTTFDRHPSKRQSSHITIPLMHRACTRWCMRWTSDGGGGWTTGRATHRMGSSDRSSSGDRPRRSSAVPSSLCVPLPSHVEVRSSTIEARAAPHVRRISPVLLCVSPCVCDCARVCVCPSVCRATRTACSTLPTTGAPSSSSGELFWALEWEPLRSQRATSKRREDSGTCMHMHTRMKDGGGTGSWAAWSLCTAHRAHGLIGVAFAALAVARCMHAWIAVFFPCVTQVQEEGGVNWASVCPSPLPASSHLHASIDLHASRAFAWIHVACCNQQTYINKND